MKKFVSILLTVAMVIGLVPMLASADVVTEDFTNSAVYAKYGWSAVGQDAMNTGDTQVASALLTNEAAYHGSKALRVQLDHSGFTSSSTWEKGINFTFPRKFDAVEGEQYKITAYVKSNNSVPTEKLVNTVYFRYCQYRWKRLITNDGLTETVNEAVGNDGWYKIEGVITAESGRTAQDIQLSVRNAKNTATAANGVAEADIGKLDFYIDGITAEVIDTGEDILGGRWGSFEDVREEDATAADFFNDYADYGWTSISNENKQTNSFNTYVTVTEKEAIVGSHSLHIDYAGSSAWNQGLNIKSGLSLTGGTTYKYTFYTKNLSMKDAVFYIGSSSGNTRLYAIAAGTDTTASYTYEKEDDGWYKVTVTHTPAKNGVFTLFASGTSMRDFYIDGVTVTQGEDTTDLLGGVGSFEPLHTWETEDFKTVYADYGWSGVAEDSMNSGDVQVASATITNEDAYTGEKSLNLKLDHSGFTSSATWEKGINLTFPKSLDTIEGEKYKVTAYVKSNNSVPTEKLINVVYFRYAQWSSAKMTDSAFSNATITAAGDNGWYKLEGTLTMPAGKNAQDIQLSVKNAKNVSTAANGATANDIGKVDFFIDGIEIIAVDTNEKIIGGRWGTFEELASTDETAVDFMESYSEYGDWKAVSNEGKDTNKYDTKVTVTAEKAIVGTNSLHIDYAGSSAWNQGFVMIHNSASMSANTKYTYTFYAYGLNEKDAALYFGSSASDTRLSVLTMGTDYTVEDAANGWKKFVVTHTPAKAGTFRLAVQGDKRYRDIYLDGITVTAEGSTADLLGGDGSFEEEKEEPVIPDPDDPELPEDPVPEVIETEDFMDATVRTSYGWGNASVDTPSAGDVQETAAVITNQAAYTGKKSLRLTLDHSGFTSDQTWQKGMYFYFLRKFDVFTEGEQLKLTAYVKSNNSVSAEKLAGAIYFRYAGNKEVRILSSEVTSASVTKGAKAGWYKLEGVITVPAGATLGDFRLGVKNAKNTATAANGATGDDVGVLDFFIDEITLENITTGEQIIGTKWGTFEENYELPDATADNFMTDYKDYGWTTAMNENGQTNKFSTLAEVTAADAAVGNKSLHIDYAGSSVWSAGLVFRHSAQLTANKTYTYTFYTKGIGTKDAVLYFGAASDNTRLADMASGKYTAATYTMTPAEEADGWMKVVVTHTPSKDGAFTLAALGTQVRNFYIDGLTVTEQGSDVDLLDGDGNFERDAIYDYAAGTTRIFDESFNEISKLTKENGGQKIIIRNAVMNNFLTESKTAQMIVAIYDGFEIIQTIMPEQITITKDDKFKAINTEVTLPEFDSEGEYAVKVFVWDGTTNMKPLTDSVDFIVE